MNRSLKSALLASAIAIAALGLVAPAADATTTVNTSWNGAGQVNSNGSATGSSSYTFAAGGNTNVGSVSYTNQEDNPYGYGVADTSVNAAAQVGNGGLITSTFNRIGSYSGLYGAAGQSVSSMAYSSDGSAALVTNASVNYASLSDLGHYGVTQTPNGNTAEANGTSIQVGYTVNTGAVGAAGINVVGAGSASITQNFAGASAHGFSMGVGGGDYQLASFTAAGIGTVNTGGVATKSLSLVNTGGTIYGTSANPASVNTTINYDTTGAAPGTKQTWNYGISGGN